jgi:hypothetical protein
MVFSFAQLVGRYGLVVSGELLAFIERSFVEVAPEGEREGARRAALAEAHGATLEVRTDGSVISASGGHELYRSQLAVTETSYEVLELEKPGGGRVVLRLLDSDTLEASQLGRPLLTFKRLSTSGPTSS